jgi:hypothetical protein
VPRRGRESWLGLMWEAELLRRPLVFSRSHKTIWLSEDGSWATKDPNYASFDWRDAMSKVVMRAGRHYVEFTKEREKCMMLGVVRAGWDVEGGGHAFGAHGNCFYHTQLGSCTHSPSGRVASVGCSWEGMQCAEDDGDRIGMLLDLDQGSMTVYKNDERLGVMMPSGLSGEYSWAVELFAPHSSVMIESAQLPGPGE